MMKKRQTLTLLFIHFAFTLSYITAQTTTLVAVGTNGKLVYTADAKGNVIPDFSGVGYMNSEAVIPIFAPSERPI